jgi:serine/threonine protein kinase
MAPEVLLKKEYNEKCDVWSVGVLMYLILAGQPAFYSKDRDETIKLITEGKLQFKGISHYLTFDRGCVDENFK